MKAIETGMISLIEQAAAETFVKDFLAIHKTFARISPAAGAKTLKRNIIPIFIALVKKYVFCFFDCDIVCEVLFESLVI